MWFHGNMNVENIRKKEMDMDEFGVSDSNFADASEILCDEREELIIKLMEKMENENN